MSFTNNNCKKIQSNEKKLKGIVCLHQGPRLLTLTMTGSIFAEIDRCHLFKSLFRVKYMFTEFGLVYQHFLPSLDSENDGETVILLDVKRSKGVVASL